MLVTTPRHTSTVISHVTLMFLVLVLVLVISSQGFAELRKTNVFLTSHDGNDETVEDLRHRGEVRRTDDDPTPALKALVSHSGNVSIVPGSGVDIFPDDYDRFTIPSPETGGPLSVLFSTKVRDIQSIDEGQMDITVEWYVRLYWVDLRLLPPLHRFTNSSPWVNIDPSVTSRLWLPTVYIDHVKEISTPSLLVLPHSLRITRQGLLRYSVSVITKLACPMDFTAYPFDKQVCYMKLESYQFRSFEVEYGWHASAIESSKGIRTDHFTASFMTDDEEIVSHENASYSFVQVRIVLSRKLSYHLMNTYIPSGLFVVVSWLTFFIPVDIVPGRMVLTITTLLTMVSMFNTVRDESPKVSYAKAIDLWMFVCIILVFTVLFEYTVTVHLHFKAKALKVTPLEKSVTQQQAFEKPSSTMTQGQQSIGVPRTPQVQVKPRSPDSFYVTWEYRLEKYSPLIEFAMFFVFVIVYWSYWMARRSADG